MSLERSLSGERVTSPVNASLLASCDLSLHENEDELQLAARVGQVLLERNQGLEDRLHQLQAFVEETLAENRRLNSQVLTLKESCQTLEDDREQLESSLLRSEQEADALRRKNSLAAQQVGELEANVQHLHEQCQEGQEEVLKVRAENEKLMLLRQDVGKENSLDYSQSSLTGDSIIVSSQAQLSAEVMQLRQQLEDLALQRKVDQNEHAEEVARLVSEKRLLEQQLRRAQGLVEDLQQQNCSTPNRQPAFSSIIPSPSLSPVSHERGARRSLWNEMESQYELLQKDYDLLIQRCQCGAVNGSIISDSGVPQDFPPPGGSSYSGASNHHHLFNELFAMLHQFKTELRS